MKNFLLAFFVFLLWSVFGMWYYSCIVKGLCDEAVTETIPKTQTEQILETAKDIPDSETKVSNSFEFKDNNGNVLFTFPDNLGIKANDYSVTFPDGEASFNDSFFKFLNDYQDKELEITGLFNNQDLTSDKALGLKRANFIKDLLVNFGVNPDRISVKDKQDNFDYNADGYYKNGILFNFKDLSEDKLKTIESGIANKTLYSGFASKGFKPDNTLQAYAIELKNYMAKYPNKNADIIGHTDSSGDDDANMWFGMERAKNVKQYLVSQGIDGNRLNTLSKGETEPVESNATIEGRRKNRRIEIKVN